MCADRSKLLIIGVTFNGESSSLAHKTLLQVRLIWVFPKIGGTTPKSSILLGFSIINHPFWGTPIFLETPIFRSKHIGKPPTGSFLFDLMHTCEPNERDDRILFISFPGCSIRNPFHDSFYIPDNWAASSLIYPKTTRFRFGAVGIPIFSNFEPFYLFKARVTWLPRANCNFQMELVIGSRCKWPKIDG